MATGDHDWTAGEQVTAANVDDYLMLQAVQQYATAAARDAALSARKRENMITAQADINTLTVYSGAAWSSIGPVHGALIDWTPVVTQSNTPTLTVNKATYQRVGRMAHVWWVVTVTSAGTAANPVTVSIPVAMAAGWISASAHLGAGTVYDSSATLRYPGLVVPSGASTIVYFPSSFAAATTATLGTSDFTAALASGDIIGGYCTYETAADA